MKTQIYNEQLDYPKTKTKQKKIFIISFNQISTEFWKERINLDYANYWHWKSPEEALNNLTTIWPDIIIVDGYWQC